MKIFRNMLDILLVFSQHTRMIHEIVSDFERQNWLFINGFTIQIVLLPLRDSPPAVSQPAKQQPAARFIAKKFGNFFHEMSQTLN